MLEIDELLSIAVKKNASDLHLSVSASPLLRIDGDIQAMADQAPLTKENLEQVCDAITTDSQRQRIVKELELDFSYAVKNSARFRVNAYHDNRGLAIAFRTIPDKIPSFEELGMDDTFSDLCCQTNGLVLVTGPTGSGKSTTLAAMINCINKNTHSHILTIEDPIEFIHHNKNCLINQRELGCDTLGFDIALRSALRQDPDIILAGEIRDLETIRLALTAAETGHLVFTTLHTNSAAGTINRIIDVFPAGEKEMVRSMLAETLRATVAQQLHKKKGGGRIASREIMLRTPAIANMIRENKIPQIYSAIQTGRGVGMNTMEQSIEELVAAGIIQP